MFVHKCVNGNIDYDFGFRRNSHYHHYNTRQRDDLQLPLIRKIWSKQTLTYAAINDWNSLNKKVRSITSDLSFKTELKRYFR